MRRKYLLGFSVLVVIFALHLYPNYNFTNSLETNGTNVEIIEDLAVNEPNLSNLIGEDFFSGEGDANSVKIFYDREETFLMASTETEGININNPIEGWNMTSFNLNFTALSTTETEVRIQTRVDEGDVFDNDGIHYANSFEIPNSCYLKNISMFIQIPGPRNTGQPHTFRITVYNATNSGGELAPHQALHEGSDQTLWEMIQWDQTQPVRWYQANFTNRLLDIGNTINNTFFAVFEMINWNADSKYDGYYFYALDEPEDEYYSKLMRKNKGSTIFNELPGKTGTFKIRVAPIQLHQQRTR